MTADDARYDVVIYEIATGIVDTVVGTAMRPNARRLPPMRQSGTTHPEGWRCHHKEG